MSRFLSNLLRKFQTANTTQVPRRAPLRARLGLEALEDRMLLSAAATATFIPATDTLNVAVHQQNETITFTGDAKHAGELDVLLGTQLLGQFSIAKAQTVNVSLTSHDTVTVNDNNGVPFASGSTISLSGSGSSNALTLIGNVTIPGSESYVAGGAGAPGGELTLDESQTTFEFTSAIQSVTDALKDTRPFIVSASGQNVTLKGNNGLAQALTGLSVGGAGDTLTYSNKSSVLLQVSTFNETATVTLNAAAAPAGEKEFEVELFGSQEQQNVVVNATPSTVTTTVSPDETSAASVFVVGNSGPLTIGPGSIGTKVILGQGLNGSPHVTSGIKANVSVLSDGSLTIDDSANHTTHENVTVTQSTVSGTGLFGNSSVQVTYSEIDAFLIDTGDLASGPAESYTIENSPSSLGSSTDRLFATDIQIQDDAKAGLNVGVFVNAQSGLNLILNPEGTTAGPTTANFHASDATFLTGFHNIAATFQEGFESIVQFDGPATIHTFTD